LFEFWLAVRKPTSADKLEEFAECKPRPAGNSFDEVTGTFTVRVQTQHGIWKLREDPLNDEQRTRPDVNLLFVHAN
jgi:hypothetical protein